MRVNKRIILTSVGIVILPLAILPPMIGTFLPGAMYSEVIRVRETGMIKSPEVIHWSEWREGAGLTYRGDLAERIPAEAVILRHRIGTDSQPLAFIELHMYQAEYLLPDGSTKIWAADGPEHLIQADVFGYRVATWSIIALSAALFVAASFAKERPREASLGGSPNAETRGERQGL